MKKLDPVLDCDLLMLHLGAAMGALSCSSGPYADREKQTYQALWRLIPLVKALRCLAAERPDRARELYAETLREPMPFGEPPLGLPGEEN